MVTTTPCLSPRQGEPAGAAGGEFLHPAGGDAEDVPLGPGGAYAGERHLLHIPQQKAAVVQKAAHGAIEAGFLILRPNAPDAQQSSILLQSHDLGRGRADVDSQDYAHGCLFPAEKPPCSMAP
jgi:hypothetical protein